MTFATQARHGLRYVTEDSYGVQPTQAQTIELRHTGCDLALKKKSVESDEIRDDRQIPHLILGQNSVEGDLDFELSFGAYDDLLSGALFGTWQGNVLKVGSQQSSFLLERVYSDINQYLAFSGCVINELAFSVQPESMISGRFGILGKNMAQETTAISQSPTASPSNVPFDSFSGVIEEGGHQVGYIAGLDMKLENGLEQTFALGQDSAQNVIAGRSRLSGELTAYVEDVALINKFLQKTPSSLKLTVDGQGGEYEIFMPHILYTGAELPVKGDGALTLTLPFVGLYDPTEMTNLRLTRTAA
jgi:Phage tail tube protein